MDKKKTIAIAPPRGSRETQDYISWLSSYGFETLILKPGINPLDYDALILTGGADLGKSPERDNNELFWFHQSYTQIPIIGICRGMHLVNVALGGTLWNDLSEKIFIKHASDQKAISEEKGKKHSSTWHKILITNSSLIENLTYEIQPVLEVNSRHHQGIKDLAKDLEIIARCPDDGLIEACGNQHCFLVQWHPEKKEVQNKTCSRMVLDWLISKTNNYKNLKS